MKNKEKTKILFVCMGNICRSPTLEGVVRERALRIGVATSFELDSAGTHGYHIGDPPDRRAVMAAARRGYDISGLRARQVCADDFHRFDLILAMDQGNYQTLHAACPVEQRQKLGLMLDYAPVLGEKEVPDPYYGGTADFERVLDLAEAAADGLLTAFANAPVAKP